MKKTILVTGGLGFIGSNFIQKALSDYNNIQILNLDAELDGSNSLNLKNLKNNPNYSFYKGNINDKKIMSKLIEKCDVVVNFAAESFVDRSIFDAEPFVHSNINGVFSILETIKREKKRFIQISTDEVFGSIEGDSATENTILNPSSPYSASKAAAELLVNSYVTTYDLDCIITRCTNNYGMFQLPEKLIPKVIILAMQEKRIPIYGKGRNVRDWIFVDDHCDAIMKVLFDGKSGQAYNVSANNELDNLTLVKKILSMMGKSEDLLEFVEDRPGHDLRYSLNSQKIRNELRWSEKMNFEHGLQKTINWYLSNPNHWPNLTNKVFNLTPWKN